MVDVLLLEGPDGMKYKATQVVDRDEWEIKPFSVAANIYSAYNSDWWKRQTGVMRFWCNAEVFLTAAELKRNFKVLAKTSSDVDLSSKADWVVHYD